MIDKICKRCEIEKELGEFNIRSKSIDGRERICRECNKKERKSKYTLKRKIKPEPIKEFHKVCNVCEGEKHIEKFHKHKGGKYGVDSRCKECNIKNSSEYEKKNKRYLVRYWNNPEKYRKKAVEYDKKRVKEDINYRIRKHLRVRFYELVKKENKSDSIINLIGCVVPDYKIYLESKFLPIFAWENQGLVWEIDHIIPLSKFDLTDPEQQKKAFHYTNTEPRFKTTAIAESYGYKNQIGNRNKLNKIL